MNQVLKLMQGKDYIHEGEVIEGVEGFSKTKVKRTIKKDHVLSSVKLTRFRANKKIKIKYGIASNGYPFVLAKTT